MIMTAATLSLRLPPEIRKRLDHATEMTRRSRSQIVQIALERHLDDIAADAPVARTASRTARIRALAGAGARSGQRRTTEEIDAHIRWLRDND
jgi:predicted DNA-binding protein